MPCERGDSGEGRRWLDLLAEMRESEDAQAIAGYAVAEARVLRAEGRLAEALAAAERGTAAAEQVGATFLYAKLSLVEALEAAAGLDDAAAVGRLLSTLDALPPGRLTPLLRAQRARFRARTDGADAPGELGLAERLFEEIGLSFYLAVTQLEHAERLEALGRTGEGEALLAAAREAFERLGAQPWLERAAAPARVGARS